MGNRRALLIFGASMILCDVSYGAESDRAAAASLPKQWKVSCWLAEATPHGSPAPCSLRVSVAGDERSTTAWLVRERSGKRRRGIAVLSDDGQTVLIGAGIAVGGSGDDLDWMGEWTVIQPLDAEDRLRFGEGNLDGQVLVLLPADGCSPSARGKGPLLVILRRVESAGNEARRKIVAEAWDLAEPRRRLAGLDVLRGLNVQPIKGCLLPNLGASDEAVRLETAHVLASSHVTEALSTIAGWLSPSSKEVSPFSRATVADMVGELGGAESVSLLARAAADPDWDVRQAAVRGLANVGGTAATAAILSRLGDVDARIRLAAVRALEVLGDPRVLAPLVKMFADPDLATRLAAMDAVTEIGGESAAPEFLRLLRDANPQVQERAAQALGELGAISATPELIHLLHQAPKAGPDVEVIVSLRRAEREQARHTDPRCAAARALSKLQDPRAVTELLRAFKKATPAANPRDKTTLLARDEGFAGCVSGALLGLGERAVEPLVTCLEQGDTCAPPAIVIKALGTLGESRKTLEVSDKAQEAVAGALLRCLSRGDACAPPMTVMEALGRVGDPKAIPALSAELMRTRVRPANPTLILTALENTHDAGIIVPLLEFAKTSQPLWLRLQAIRAVKPVLDARAEPLLLALLDEEDWSQKEEVMGLLSKLRSRVALPKALEVLAATTRGDPRVAEDLRWTAMTMLTEMGGPGGSATPEILPPLLAMAKTPSHLSGPALVKARKRVAQDEPHACEASGLMEPAAYAMRALGGLFRVHPDRYLRLLLEAELAHANEARVLAAIGALVAMRDPASVPSLLPLTRSPKLDIRRAVAAVLGDFGDRSAVAPLLAALRDKDDGVRGAAAWALGKLGDPSTLPAIVQATNHRGEATAVNATAALARFADPSTLEHLKELTKHRHHHVRGNAAVALGRLGGETARGILLDMARADPATTARLAAFRALHDMGGSDPELRNAATTRDGSDSFARAALAILGTDGAGDHAPVKDSWVFDHHISHWLFALTTPDGLVRIGYSDLCGVYSEEQVPSGDVSLYGANLASP